MYPAFDAAPVAAGLDEIRGWLPIIRASSRLFVFSGLCQPGPTGYAIASKNTFAAYEN
jgi:hypothetical protein